MANRAADIMAKSQPWILWHKFIKSWCAWSMPRWIRISHVFETLWSFYTGKILKIYSVGVSVDMEKIYFGTKVYKRYNLELTHIAGCTLISYFKISIAFLWRLLHCEMGKEESMCEASYMDELDYHIIWILVGNNFSIHI